MDKCSPKRPSLQRRPTQAPNLWKLPRINAFAELWNACVWWQGWEIVPHSHQVQSAGWFWFSPICSTQQTNPFQLYKTEQFRERGFQHSLCSLPDSVCCCRLGLVQNRSGQIRLKVYRDGFDLFVASVSTITTAKIRKGNDECLVDARLLSGIVIAILLSWYTHWQRRRSGEEEVIVEETRED